MYEIRIVSDKFGELYCADLDDMIFRNLGLYG